MGAERVDGPDPLRRAVENARTDNRPGLPPGAARMVDAAPAKCDGESWVDYAHRLERRIARQRAQISRQTELRKVPGDTQARARIAFLERLVGKKELSLERLRAGVAALKAEIADPTALGLLSACLDDPEPWEPDRLLERMEAVFVALGGRISESRT